MVLVCLPRWRSLSAAIVCCDSWAPARVCFLPPLAFLSLSLLPLLSGAAPPARGLAAGGVPDADQTLVAIGAQASTLRPRRLAGECDMTGHQYAQSPVCSSPHLKYWQNMRSHFELKCKLEQVSLKLNCSVADSCEGGLNELEVSEHRLLTYDCSQCNKGSEEFRRLPCCKTCLGLQQQGGQLADSMGRLYTVSCQGCDNLADLQKQADAARPHYCRLNSTGYMNCSFSHSCELGVPKNDTVAIPCTRTPCYRCDEGGPMRAECCHACLDKACGLASNASRHVCMGCDATGALPSPRLAAQFQVQSSPAVLRMEGPEGGGATLGGAVPGEDASDSLGAPALRLPALLVLMLPILGGAAVCAITNRAAAGGEDGLDDPPATSPPQWPGGSLASLAPRSAPAGSLVQLGFGWSPATSQAGAARYMQLATRESFDDLGAASVSEDPLSMVQRLRVAQTYDGGRLDETVLRV